MGQLERALKKAGREDVEVIPSKNSPDLYALASGVIGAHGWLGPEDIGRLGDWYIRDLYNQIGSLYRGWDQKRGRRGYRAGAFAPLPPRMEAWRETIDTDCPFGSMKVEAMRSFLSDHYSHLLKKKDSGMPEYWWKSMKTSKVGFTADVTNPDLLQKYPLSYKKVWEKS